ncbi:isochorismatase family protein, partial [Staphylococcus intermedius]
MNKALVVLDLQKGFVEQGNFQERIDRIEKMISHFEENKNEVIFFKHIDYDIENSPLFFKNKDNIEIIVDTNNSKVFEKSEPSAFT